MSKKYTSEDIEEGQVVFARPPDLNAWSPRESNRRRDKTIRCEVVNYDENVVVVKQLEDLESELGPEYRIGVQHRIAYSAIRLVEKKESAEVEFTRKWFSEFASAFNREFPERKGSAKHVLFNTVNWD